MATTGMDFQFPRQLFPSFYSCGPPEARFAQPAGKWGSYNGVQPQGGPGSLSSRKFVPKHRVRGELWRHTEPVPLPLFNPKHSFLWLSSPPDPLDYIQHMQNFFADHSRDAFGCMGELLAGNFDFDGSVNDSDCEDSVNMCKHKQPLYSLEIKQCTKAYVSAEMTNYSALLSDVVPDVPVELLAALLHEELTQQRDRLLFSEATTGGALAFVPLLQGGGGGSQKGCLLYPGNRTLDRLNFHRAELQHQEGGAPPRVVLDGGDLVSFQLKAPVRQIDAASLFDSCCVAVRSDHMCGVWRFGESSDPHLLQVIDTSEVATCISTSPHVLGEVLVASESGAAHLWTVGKGTQKVRKEDTNLYFNANSPWRWCEFSAHPRVMVYADRTGAELTDIRDSAASSHTLFRISNTVECLSGERLILSRYLRDVHPFHHLVTTQYSAYLMDERFPCIPMLKWDHMMQSPPTFCHIAPGQKGGGASTTKVLLGSQRRQEITLLQYSGGRAEACTSVGPPQALHRPSDSLRELPVQIPHRRVAAADRLSAPATGLTCIQTSSGSGVDSMCVLQLTEAGDIFYQILQHQQPDAHPPAPAAQGESSQPPAWAEPISNTSSDEDAIEPTQQGFVPETPERKSRNPSSDSEGSDSGRNRRSLRRLCLQVVSNLDPEPEPESGPEPEPEPEPEPGPEPGPDTDSAARNESDGKASKQPDDGEREETPSVVKLSEGALAVWRRWLKKTALKTPKKRRQRRLLTVPAGDILSTAPSNPTPEEEERVRAVRQQLRDVMSERYLIAASAEPQLPFPELVDAEAWPDQLSRRLTASWQGDEAWKAWWAEHLGHNKDQKVADLRRKRRREREEKRRSGRGLELSGSFTSSTSYQSDLDSFSDLSGWSSTSQGACSDMEGVPEQGSQSDDTPGADIPRAETPHAEIPRAETLHADTVRTDTPRAETPRSETPRADTPLADTPCTDTPSALQSDDCSLAPTASPSSVTAERQTRSMSRLLTGTQTPRKDAAPAVTPPVTPSSQRRGKRQADDYLNSLFGSQDEPSQVDSCFPDDDDTAAVLPRKLVVVLPRAFPRRSVRANPSQDSSIFSPSLSQSSQGRPGPSQSSQPKKKKSQMGF